MSSTPSSTMPPAMPNTDDTNDEKTMVAPIRAMEATVIARKNQMASARLRAARQRAVDHVDRVLDAVDRDEGTEARSLLLAEQHLVEHVEPVERDARPAVLGL